MAMAKGKKVGGKKREKKNVPVGICHIQASFNNTIISFTDPQGNVLSWSSTGTVGFKGSRKSTPFAAKTATEDAVKKAKEHGIRQVEVEVRGPGTGREAALRAIAAEGLKVTTIRDVTPIPHNGCKAPKLRRI
jgi:small subunit ribosomal protein S11